MAQINKPTDYFNTVLYTGNGSTQSITGVGFQPDWTWIKSRSNATNHQSVDSVRGNTKALFTDLTNAEATYTQGITSFDSDGFSLGNLAGYNGSSYTFASWNWLAGGTASSNTDGTITSSVSANTTSGFSICTFDTGASTNISFGHGLGTAPSMVICKNRESAGSNWVVGHDGLGWTKWIKLNGTDAGLTSSDAWQNTAPTSSIVTSTTTLLGANQDYVAYCFAEKKGFSKFGSYTGNGSTDGTFVYTGFKPAFVIQKRTDSTGNWHMFDNKRDVDNVVEKRLWSNLSDAEPASLATIDFLSNGFKWRNTALGWNGSGTSNIYMAFAESPLVGTNNIPATAR